MGRPPGRNRSYPYEYEKQREAKRAKIAKYVGFTCRITYKVRGFEGRIEAVTVMRAKIVGFCDQINSRNQFVMLEGSDFEVRVLAMMNVLAIEPANFDEKAAMLYRELKGIMDEREDARKPNAVRFGTDVGIFGAEPPVRESGSDDAGRERSSDVRSSGGGPDDHWHMDRAHDAG